MHWLDLYRELYVGASGILCGIFLIIIWQRLKQRERWARGLAFVASSLIGFLVLSIAGFAAHFGQGVGTDRIFLYPIPLVLLAIGIYLITTSEIGLPRFNTKGERRP